MSEYCPEVNVFFFNVENMMEFAKKSTYPSCRIPEVARRSGDKPILATTLAELLFFISKTPPTMRIVQNMKR